jgi:hypothetical protein
MKYVEILKLNNDGTQRVIATCKLDNKMKCICEGDKIVVGNFLKNGITVNSRTLFPANGLLFLDGLKDFFSSGYISASDVKELAD